MILKPVKKLSATLIAGLLGASTINAATHSEHTNVNVNVSDNKGKVIIVKGVDGESKTIEEKFILKDGDDADTVIQGILKKHGVDNKSGNKTHKITKMLDHHDKDLVWVQKNNDVNVNLNNGKATVTIIKDDNGEVETIEEIFDVNDSTDINVLIDDLMEEHGIDTDGAEVHRKVIKLDKSFTRIHEDKPRLGFMASVEDDGWKIVSVVPESGAGEAGIQKGDVIVSIDGQSTGKDGLGLTEFIAMDKAVGDVTEVVVDRAGEELALTVTAKVIDSPDIVMEMNTNSNWFSKSGNEFTFNASKFDEAFSGLHVDVEHLEKMIDGLGDKEIRVVTTTDAGAYFFSDSKMDQWLGKNHHFSTITESLGKYFGTTQGVLVLEVDKDNKLGLKDGDVIQAINGQDVKSPKDVVKIMSGFKSGESFQVEIIREKETIYLES